MEWLNTFFDQLPVWIPLATAVISAAAAIAAVTPNKIDNKIVDALLMVVNWLGLNVGKAKRSDEDKK